MSYSKTYSIIVPMLKDFYNIKTLDDIDKIIDKLDEVDIISSTSDYLLNERILLKNTLFSIVSAQKNRILCSDKHDLNLSHLFKKHLFSSFEIKSILNRIPNVNRRLGIVPDIFLDKTKNKTECANKIFEIFAKYSLILNYDYEEDLDGLYDLDKCTEAFTNELSNVVNKGISLSYVGHGVNGNGFKLTIDGKNFFYKVFYPHDDTHDLQNDYRHGGCIEPAFGVFANENARKNQFVRFYMGQISTKYDRDAFMLTDFLEKNYSRPKEFLKIDYIGVKDSEIRRFDNMLEGKIVDFGGMVTNKEPELNSPKLRKLVRVIINHIVYRHDKDKFAFSWKINNNNLNSLKRFISKYDTEIYAKALDIIKNQVKISDKIIVKLSNINDIEGEIEDEQILKSSDIITDDVMKLKENIAEFQLRCKTETNPSEYSDGYMILDLNDKKQCVVMYDKNNKAKLLRIEKEENKQFKTIIELRGNSISQYNTEGSFYTLLNKLAQV